jgi:hypothetical protein
LSITAGSGDTYAFGPPTFLIINIIEKCTRSVPNNKDMAGKLEIYNAGHVQDFYLVVESEPSYEYVPIMRPLNMNGHPIS